MLVEDDAWFFDRRIEAQIWIVEQFCQQAFSLLNRASPQIPSVEFQQVEGAKDRGRFAAMTSDQLKDGKPVFVANDRFAVDQAWPCSQSRDSGGNERKARREIVAMARYEPDASAVAPRENADAVMLEFVQPPTKSWSTSPACFFEIASDHSARM
jgi:hypothetical protein